MKGFKFWVFSFIMVFASCTVDEFDNSTTISTEADEPEIVIINDMVNKSKPAIGNAGQEIGCIVVAYPFEVITSDSVVHQINSNFDFQQLEQQTNAFIIDFKYPLVILDNIGVSHTVQSLWELASYFAGCYPDSLSVSNQEFPAFLINENSSCYTVKYPITLKDGANNVYTIASDNDFITLLSQKDLLFVFPFSLLDMFQVEKIITSPADLEQALFDCNNNITVDNVFNYEYLACYKLVYPLSIKVLNSPDPLIVSGADMMSQVFYQGKFVEFIFPLRLENQDGSILVIQNAAELDSAVNNCYIFGDLILLLTGTELISNTPCYDIVFPMRAKSPAGVVSTYENLTQFQPILADSLSTSYQVVYPLDVVLKQNNNWITLRDVFDVIGLLTDCN